MWLAPECGSSSSVVLALSLCGCAVPPASGILLFKGLPEHCLAGMHSGRDVSVHALGRGLCTLTSRSQDSLKTNHQELVGHVACSNVACNSSLFVIAGALLVAQRVFGC